MAAFATIKGKKFPIEFTNGTSFRLQSLPGGQPPAEGFKDHSRVLFTATCYLWAMLPKEARTLYPDPESVAEAVTPEELPALMDAIVSAMTKDGEGSAKKAKPRSARSSA